MSKLTLAKAASAVAFLTIVSKVLGFLREASLAAVFGATADTDAFLVAQTIPYLLFSTVSYALTTTFIPIYSQIKIENGDGAAFRFANSVSWIVLFIALVFVLGGELLAEPLVRLVAPGLDARTAELTKYLSRIVFPMMIFQLLSGILTGILQAHGEFVVPTLSGLAQNVCIITSILIFGPRYGIAAVAAGTVAGSAIASGVKLSAVRRVGFTWRRAFSLNDPGVRRMTSLVLPAIIGGGANQLNALVDRILASGLPEGRIATLEYATRLMQLAPGVIGSTIITVIYPSLSRLAARDEWNSFARGVADALSLVYFMLMPIAVGVMVLREPLVRVVFERGVFDSAATKETAWALLFLGMGIAIFSMRDLVSRVFFSLQDTRTPMILGFVTVGVNVVLNIILVGSLEQGGLALASTVASIVGLVLGLIMLRRKSPPAFPISAFLNSLLRSGFAAVVMGVVVSVVSSWLNQLFDDSRVLFDVVAIAILTCIGGLVYLALTWLLKVPEIELLKTWALRGVDRLTRKRIISSSR